MGLVFAIVPEKVIMVNRGFLVSFILANHECRSYNPLH